MVEASKPVEDMAEFSMQRWLHQVEVLKENPENLDVDTWVAFLYETTNLFKKMGSAMSMAFSGNLLISF